MKNIETFKQRCIEKGIYKNALHSNDWLNSTIGYFILTIPYGQKKGGLTKIIQRFSDRDVNSTVNFWNSNVDKNKVFNY